MTYKIIVARYNENIDWLKDEMDNCIIINKGDALNIKNEVLLKNVGRESDTYLNYIITNYDNLPDTIVFTQANIAPHRPRQCDVNYLITIKNQALVNGKSVPATFYQDDNKHSCWNKEWNIKNETFFLKNNYKNNSPITFLKWFETNINKNYPNPIKVYTNGIFAVNKKFILKRTVEYYKQLLLEVNHHINSTEGHFFERSWYYIFD